MYLTKKIILKVLNLDLATCSKKIGKNKKTVFSFLF